MKAGIVFGVLALTVSGCAGLISAFQQKSEGPNPLKGAPLSHEWTGGSRDDASCKRTRPQNVTTLSATDTEVCVSEQVYMISATHQAGPPPKRTEEVIDERILEVDGKRGPPLAMKEAKAPRFVMDCEARDSKRYPDSEPFHRMYAYEARGCVPNAGLLQGASKQAGVLRSGAQAPYLVYTFQ